METEQQGLKTHPITSKVRDFGDYKVVKAIGEGSQGQVYLVQFEGKPFALKTARKHAVTKSPKAASALNEIEIHSTLDHPFIVQLYQTFQDERHLFLRFEFLPGGDLFSLIRQESYFPNDVALFYASEITLALEYLHSKNIVYRDLKPENLLISGNGHVKLCDFGLSKVVSDLTFTLCGTPEYLAPEIVLSTGHNHNADWWALGILIYEMLVGFPPFFDENPMEIYKKISVGFFEIPAHVCSSARVLIEQLLNADQSLRPGSGKKPELDIRNQPWFEGVDWNNVHAGEVPPPWVPELSGMLDTQYFEQSSDLDFEMQNGLKTPSPKQYQVFDDF